MSAYWWVSFADPNRPNGTQFLGVAIIKDPIVPSVAGCASSAWMLGINPGGEVLAYEWIPDGIGVDPPADKVNRLLTKAEAMELDDWMAKEHADKRVSTVDGSPTQDQRHDPSNDSGKGG